MGVQASRAQLAVDRLEGAENHPGDCGSRGLYQPVVRRFYRPVKSGVTAVA